MQAAAVASLAVGFPPTAPMGSAAKVSAAAAAAAAAAALGLKVPSSAGPAESGGEGLASEVTGAENSEGLADMDDDDDDFRP